jgi:valyl-tRNA synthetase
VLVHILETSFRLLHPFMPFITEELWQNLKSRLPAGTLIADSIMIAAYPQSDPKEIDAEAERVMDAIIEIIRAIRNARAEYKVDMGKWIESRIYAGKLEQSISAYTQTIETLARSRPVTFLTEHPEGQDKNTLVLVLKEAEVYIPMSAMVDMAAEKKRLQGEMEQAAGEASRLEARLQNTEFTSKAPPAVVEKERQKLVGIKDRLARLQEQVTRLG